MRGWSEELDSYYGVSFINQTDTIAQHELALINDEMQVKYPGNYFIEEYYNDRQDRFALRPTFVDPKEELMWKIRWA